MSHAMNLVLVETKELKES